MNYLILFFRFLKNNFGKIFLTAIAFFTFAFLLFPFGDLSDFISAKVSSMTGNQVYLQFDKLTISPLTSSIDLDNVLLETKQVENLNIKKLTIIPSVMALISKKPGGKITAVGLLSGSASVDIKPSSGKSDIQKSDINVSLEKISLKDLQNTLNLSFPISGQINLSGSASVDPAFAEQPEGDLSINIQKFELASGSVVLPDLGSINLPEIKFSSVDLKTKFQTGKFIIENGKLGLPSDDFHGTVSGDFNLIMQNINGQITPVVNGYNLSVNLLAKSNFKDRAAFFLNFIDRFQSADATGTRYKFKLVSSSPGMPPLMTPLQ